MDSSITVENIGAVLKVEIPIPESGGVVVLRGRNGSGKSTTLRAVGALVGGEVEDLDKRDGTAGGSVRGFGASLTVKKSVRRNGVAEVESIESRLSPHELVNPGIADPAKADARRIKALCQLAQLDPDKRAFRELFANAADFSLVMDDLESGDLVQMAAQLKRRLEAIARDVEEKASEASGKAAGHRQVAEAGRCDFVPGDPAVLQHALEEAIRTEARLASDRESGLKVLERSKKAVAALESAKATYTGKSIEVAAAALQEATARKAQAAAALAQAKEQFEAACRDLETSQLESKAAIDYHLVTEQWHEAIDTAASVQLPSEETVAAAQAAVAAAHERVRKAALHKESVAQFKLAKTYEGQAATYRERAASFRDMARRTDSVLSEAIGTLNSPFNVVDGRLVLTTDRGEELYEELSDGERWRVAIDTLAPFCPEHGVMVIPQAAWGELDPHNRAEIDRVFRERGIVCLTAEATDDDAVSATVWGNGGHDG